jgi:hypothetical protein
MLLTSPCASNSYLTLKHHKGRMKSSLTGNEIMVSSCSAAIVPGWNLLWRGLLTRGILCLLMTLSYELATHLRGWHLAQRPAPGSDSWLLGQVSGSHREQPKVAMLPSAGMQRQVLGHRHRQGELPYPGCLPVKTLERFCWETQWQGAVLQRK